MGTFPGRWVRTARRSRRSRRATAGCAWRGRLLPAGCPEVEAGQGTIRPPLLSDRVDLARRGHVVEPVQPLNRRSDAEVANRENVLPIKVDEQKHVRRPAPKSARRRDLFANLVIRKLVQVVDLQLARD